MHDTEVRFQIKHKKEKFRQVIFLFGNLDEDAKVDTLHRLTGTVVFDFEGVTGINSCGVRNWVNLMKRRKGHKTYYRNCPPTIVKQLTMVPSFRADAITLSAYVPYLCHHCGHEDRKLMDFSQKQKKVETVLSCPACGSEELEIDADEKTYFDFAA